MNNENLPVHQWGRLIYLSFSEIRSLAELWQSLLLFFDSYPPNTTITESFLDSLSFSSLKSSVSLASSLSHSSHEKLSEQNGATDSPISSSVIREGATVAELRRMLYLTFQDNHPHDFMLRFLRARKFKVDKALLLLLQVVLWRVKKNLEAVLEEGEKKIKINQMQGESYVYNTDKDGRPIIYINVALHDKNANTADELEFHTLWMVETIRTMLSPPALLTSGDGKTWSEGVENCCIAFNMTGFGVNNMDYPTVKFLINCLQNQYPESLGKCLIVNAPWVFNGVFKLIRPLLDPVIQSKIEMINTDDLAKFIPLENLPAELQAQSSKTSSSTDGFKYKYVAMTEEEMKWSVDQAQKERLVRERLELAGKWEEWIRMWSEMVLACDHAGTVDSSYGQNFPRVNGVGSSYDRSKDEDVVGPLRRNWIELDKIVRCPTLYHRIKVLTAPGSGNVRWENMKKL